MDFSKITEQPSRYDHLEQMSVAELLQHINDEDVLVAEAVRKAIPQIKAGCTRVPHPYAALKIPKDLYRSACMC